MVPGTFLAANAASVAAMRGVYATPAVDRAYSMPAGLQRLVGRVDGRGAAAEGIELALDTLLSGQPGSLRVLRDASGRSFDSPSAALTRPVPGHAVVLTIHQDLQYIVERALREAVERLVSAFSEGARVAVATYGGKRRNPVLFSREVWPLLEAELAGDEGARSALRRHPELVVGVPCEGVGDPADIDTREDLRRLQEMLGPMGDYKMAGG
jgi:hypothetical protein